MSKSVNQIALLGNVGRVEVRATNSGTCVANVSLATNKRVKNRAGAWDEVVQWHRLVLFGRFAEIARDYVETGNRIHVLGELEYQEWEKDGEKRTTAQVLVNDLTLLTGKARGGEQGREAGASGGGETQITDDDIPF